MELLHEGTQRFDLGGQPEIDLQNVLREKLEHHVLPVMDSRKQEANLRDDGFAREDGRLDGVKNPPNPVVVPIGSVEQGNQWPGIHHDATHRP